SWRRVHDSYPEIVWATSYAALSLAAVAAVHGHIAEAEALLLHLASDAGRTTADACRAILSDNVAGRTRARRELVARAPEDTDALNFIGIAAFRAGDIASASARWTESAERNDGVAPLLLLATGAGAS